MNIVQSILQLQEIARERMRKEQTADERNSLETGMLIAEAVMELVITGRDPRGSLIQRLFSLALLYYAEGGLIEYDDG